jgi:hypothetical protein
MRMTTGPIEAGSVSMGGGGACAAKQGIEDSFSATVLSTGETTTKHVSTGLLLSCCFLLSIPCGGRQARWNAAAVQIDDPFFLSPAS